MLSRLNSCTAVKLSPDGSGAPDSTRPVADGTQQPKVANRILKELLSQDDDDEDDEVPAPISTPSSAEKFEYFKDVLPSAAAGTQRQQKNAAVQKKHVSRSRSYTRKNSDEQQPVVRSLADTSGELVEGEGFVRGRAGAKDMERNEAEPSNNSVSNNLLKVSV